LSFYKFENLTKDKKQKKNIIHKLFKRDKIVSNLLAEAIFVELVWAIEKKKLYSF